MTHAPKQPLQESQARGPQLSSGSIQGPPQPYLGLGHTRAPFQEPNQTTSHLANHPRQEASSFWHSVSCLKEPEGPCPRLFWGTAEPQDSQGS